MSNKKLSFESLIIQSLKPLDHIQKNVEYISHAYYRSIVKDMCNVLKCSSQVAHSGFMKGAEVSCGDIFWKEPGRNPFPTGDHLAWPGIKAASKTIPLLFIVEGISLGQRKAMIIALDIGLLSADDIREQSKKYEADKKSRRSKDFCPE
eukprot:312680_1